MWRAKVKLFGSKGILQEVTCKKNIRISVTKEKSFLQMRVGVKSKKHMPRQVHQTFPTSPNNPPPAPSARASIQKQVKQAVNKLFYYINTLSIRKYGKR